MPAPPAASQPAASQFVEVVDSSNRHYLVRYTVAPVIRVLADREPITREGALSWAPREVKLGSSPAAPGSAGMVVLRGVVGKV